MKMHYFQDNLNTVSGYVGNVLYVEGEKRELSSEELEGYLANYFRTPLRVEEGEEDSKGALTVPTYPSWDRQLSVLLFDEEDDTATQERITLRFVE